MNTFFEGRSWFKFDNLELALGMPLTFYTSVSKELKLKVRKLWQLSPTFVEVKRKNLVRRRGVLPPLHILNRVKHVIGEKVVLDITLVIILEESGLLHITLYL